MIDEDKTDDELAQEWGLDPVSPTELKKILEEWEEEKRRKSRDD